MFFIEKFNKNYNLEARKNKKKNKNLKVIPNNRKFKDLKKG